MNDKVTKKYIVTFYGEVTETNDDVYYGDMYDTQLRFEFDDLDEALQFTKLAEKHLIPEVVWEGNAGHYFEEEDETTIWTISLEVKVEPKEDKDNG